MPKSQEKNKKEPPLTPPYKGGEIEAVRHSLAHIMAAAVSQLYPDVKFGIGPAIANGFYYDFDLSEVAKSKFQNPLHQNKFGAGQANDKSISKSKIQKENFKISSEDLPKIEKKMQELIKKNLKFEKKSISKTEAEKLFKDQPYKLELISEKRKTKNEKLQRKTQNLTIYTVNGFIDLCAGPHISNTKQINPKAFKLTKIAGAYWRGDEKNPMLTRIYGVAFETEKELKDYLHQVEKAEKRDHRILGQKLGIYSFDDEVGPGLILWHPKGALLRQIMRQYWIEEHLKQGYQLIETPHIGRLKLWQTSGHTDFYKESMYSPMKVEKDLYQLKPMNCPFHVKIYNSTIHSYRDLPLRWAEWAQVYRYEKSGVLHGLIRVRGFTQDDAHIICTRQQFEPELKKVVEFIKKILRDFGFKKYAVYLSVRDLKNKKKFVGDDKTWNFAETILEKVLKQSNLEYTRDIGEAKFYGPAIDIKIKDALNREWQCSTLQLDMNLPDRFKMSYIDQKGKKQTPIMLHRTLLGGICRFIALLLEHYAGALPLWLAPEQIWVMPIGKAHQKYAREITEILCVGMMRRLVPTKGKATSRVTPLRVKLINTNETIGKKIRESQIQKIPYVLVVGDKETKSKTVAVRHLSRGHMGIMSLEKFLENVKIETNKKL